MLRQMCFLDEVYFSNLFIHTLFIYFISPCSACQQVTSIEKLRVFTVSPSTRHMHAHSQSQRSTNSRALTPKTQKADISHGSSKDEWHAIEIQVFVCSFSVSKLLRNTSDFHLFTHVFSICKLQTFTVYITVSPLWFVSQLPIKVIVLIWSLQPDVFRCIILLNISIPRLFTTAAVPAKCRQHVLILSFLQ